MAAGTGERAEPQYVWATLDKYIRMYECMYLYTLVCFCVCVNINACVHTCTHVHM